VTSEFICGAANTVSKGTVWLEMEAGQSVLFFGISNVIGVANIDTQNVLCTLPGHRDRVTTITKLNDYTTRKSSDISTPITIVTSSADGSIIVWEHAIGAPVTAWSIAATLQLPDHTGAITTHTSLSTTLGTLITASNSQGTLVTFFRPNSQHGENFTIIDTQNMQPMHMPNDLTLMELPSGMNESDLGEKTCHHAVLLAVGSVDAKIHLRMYPVVTVNKSNDFTYSCDSILVGMLAGHDDWIRCLSGAAYVSDGVSNMTSLYFASGSQDSKIRVWCITPSVGKTEESVNTEVTADLTVQEDDDEEDNAEVNDSSNTQSSENGVSKDGLTEEGLGEARCAFKCSAWLQTSSGSSSTDVFSELQARYLVTLDALLVGHEDWVSSIHWIRSGREAAVQVGSGVQDTSMSQQSFYTADTAQGNQQLKLFSTSMDRNMVIWCPAEDTGIWLPTTRMGDIGGNLGGSVGGNLLGFVGSCIDYRSHSVLGIGYGGSFHLWQWRKSENVIDLDSLQLVDEDSCNKETNDKDSEEVVAATTTSDEGYAWRPVSFLTGHFAAVRDVVWGYNGSFLISVSADQTCRLFAPLAASSTKGGRKWCELSRPQIHGYDLSCLQLAPWDSAPFTIYSGGDEKVVRIFESSIVVAEGLVQLSNNEWAQQYLNSTEIKDNTSGSALKSEKIHRAFIPELGLSNKAADMMSEDEIKEQASRGVDSSLWLSGPPLEGQLSDFTIWPEVKKLFGHVGDMVCMSASPCGRWVASAGKGRDASSASIRLWETRRRVCVAVLGGHESTVTALRFSPDSRFIISGGKDRTLYLYQANPEYSQSEESTTAIAPYIPCAYMSKAHKRIIWDISWITVGELNAFTSVSRDGSVKIWSIVPDAEGQNLMCKLEPLTLFNPFSNVAVTAVDVVDAEVVVLSSGEQQPSGWLLAFGAETGALQVWFLTEDKLRSVNTGCCEGSDLCSHIHTVSKEYCHGSAVRRLQWNKRSCDDSIDWQLVSGGDDHCVRVFSVSP